MLTVAFESDVKNAAVGVAIDCKDYPDRAGKGQIVCHQQFARDKRYRAGHREVNRVARGGALDGLPKRTTAAVVDVADRQCGGSERSRNQMMNRREYKQGQYAEPSSGWGLASGRFSERFFHSF